MNKNGTFYSRLFSFRNLMLFFGGALLIAALGASGFFYWRYQQVVANDPAQEIEKTIKEVGAIMALPDETPTIATVTEKEKLGEQAFFKNAENGDKVLLFVEAQKVVLYRPSTKKIIDVTTARLSDAQPTLQTSPAEPVTAEATPAPLSLAIYNGTAISGLTRRVEERIKGSQIVSEVLIRDNAKQTTYSKTLVVAVNSTAAAQAEQLAEILQGEVGELPEGEMQPNVDVIIIAGSNFQ